MLRQLIIVTCAATLSSCSYIYGDQGIIRNRDTAYLSANSINPLVIPPGLSSSTIQDHYPVSNQDYPGSKNKINLTPPELVQPQPEPVVVQNPVPAQQPVMTQSTSSSANNSAAPKQRYLVDIFQHPEYLTESLLPNTAPPAQSTGTKQTQTTATNTQQSGSNNATPAQPAPQKKRYITDYFN